MTELDTFNTIRREVDQWISKTKVELHYIQELMKQLAGTHIFPKELVPNPHDASPAAKHFAEGTWAYDHLWKRNTNGKTGDK
jgi:hypothetical protein